MPKLTSQKVKAAAKIRVIQVKAVEETTACEEINLSDQAKEGPTNFALMAYTSSSSSRSDSEIKKTPDAPIIEDWVSDDEEQDKPKPKVVKKTVKSKTVKQDVMSDGKLKKKTIFPTAAKIEVQKPIWNNVRRVNRHNSYRMSYPHPKRNFVPKAVLMKTGMRPVNAAKPKAAYNVVKRNRFNDVKAPACWVWMPKNRVVDHVSKNISASVTLKRLDYIYAQGRFKSVMAWMDAQAQGRQECSKEKEESREEYSKSRNTKKMKCLEESSRQRKQRFNSRNLMIWRVKAAAKIRVIQVKAVEETTAV
ncbi:hypothetical protein Tco_0870393 [Tanacetum coccineum]